MRFTQKCPKCEGRVFAVNTTMRLAHQRSSNDTVPLSAITVEHASNPYGDRVDLGFFESWICLQCGYTELYAGGLDRVRELAAQHPEQLRIVDATPKDGPYR